MLIAVALASAITPASPDYAGHCQSPRWSPDGRWLTWEVNYLERQAVELYVAPFGSASPPRRVGPSATSTGITSGFSVGSGSRSVNHEVSFSPASQGRFIYSSSGGSEDYDLYLDGGAALAPAPGTDGNAAWSPDGKSVVFTSSRTGQGDLYLLPLGVAGAQPRRLSTDAVASEVYATWSPDSRRVAFVGHTRTGDNLYLIEDVAAPAPRPVTHWPGTQTRPRFSPDGSMIAFFANHDQETRFDLYVMPAAGGEPRRVFESVLLNPGGPSWTPDGTALIVVKHDDATSNPVVRVPVAVGAKSRVVATGTVGNADVDVVKRADGKAWVAVAALGRLGDEVRDFRRIYVMSLD